MSSFNQLVDMMRNASNDGVKRVYSEDSGMGSLLDTESLMSVGGPSSTSSSGLFGSNPSMPLEMTKEERFSRKVFVGGLPPDIDEGKFGHFIGLSLSSIRCFRGNYCAFSTFWSVDRRLAT